MLRYLLPIPLLISCSTAPKVPKAELPKSQMATPKLTDDGTAIAFQFKTTGCDRGAVNFAPKLADGNYGEPYALKYGRSVLNLSIAKNTVDKNFVDAGRKEKLFVKLLPPGNYTAIRPTCSRASDSSTRVFYSTPPQTLVGFFEFEVEAGRTNYIGELEVNGRGGGLTLNVADRSSNLNQAFSDDYSKFPVGPLKLSLANRNRSIIATAKRDP